MLPKKAADALAPKPKGKVKPGAPTAPGSPAVPFKPGSSKKLKGMK